MAVSLVRRRGTIALVGSKVDEIGSKWVSFINPELRKNRNLRDGNSTEYHITLISPSELGGKRIRMSDIDLRTIGEIDIIDIGFGSVKDETNETWFAIVYSAWADKFRLDLSLSSKDFHVTLGFHNRDIHDVSKGCQTCRHASSLEVLEEVVKKIFALSKPNFSLKEETILRYISGKAMMNRTQRATAEFRILRMIGQISVKRSINDLIDDIGYFLLDSGYLVGIKLLQSRTYFHSNALLMLNVQARFPVLVCSDGPELEKESSHLRNINTYCISTLQKKAKVISIDKFTSTLDMFSVPRNFSWISLQQGFLVETCAPYQNSLLCGSAIPSKGENIFALYGLGVRAIITAHENHLDGMSALACQATGIRMHHFAVDDRTPPTIDQLRNMIAIIDRELIQRRGVLVHCQGGIGRTNTVIIAYMLWTSEMSTCEAKEQVGSERKMILSDSQEQQLQQWWRIAVDESPYRNKLHPSPALASKESVTASSMAVTHDSATMETGEFGSCPLGASAAGGDEDDFIYLTEALTDASLLSEHTHVHLASCPPASLLVPVPSTPSRADTRVVRHGNTYRAVAKALGLPPLILLCGYAASGKSTFSTTLVRAFPGWFVRINRDEMRGKGECQEALAAAFRTKHGGGGGGGGGKGGSGGKRGGGGGGVRKCAGTVTNDVNKTVLIDCCNLTSAKRSEWLEQTHGRRAWCVYFNVSIDICKQRIQVREGHPTIPTGSAGVTILNSMRKQLQPPEESEGFERVFEVHDFASSAALLSAWGIKGAAVSEELLAGKLAMHSTPPRAAAAAATLSEEQTTGAELTSATIPIASTPPSLHNLHTYLHHRARRESVADGDEDAREPVADGDGDGDGGARSAGSDENKPDELEDDGTSEERPDTITGPQEVTASGFAAVRTVSSASTHLLKFPRTPHALNLGAATRDDKILSHAGLSCMVGAGRRVTIEEKVDGANMGLSIDATQGTIMVQNRSHFISTSYHPQFAPLGKWLSQHSDQLWELLEPDRHVLYGEWLYATHSVQYSRLPGWFVAYDLYDKVADVFLSRKELADRLASTKIPLVPLVYKGEVCNVEDLTRFVYGPSQYGAPAREGIVIRLMDESGDRLISRAKIVRSDFIAGNKRWNCQSKMQVNSIDPDREYV